MTIRSDQDERKKKKKKKWAITHSNGKYREREILMKAATKEATKRKKKHTNGDWELELRDCEKDATMLSMAIARRKKEEEKNVYLKPNPS